MDRIKATYRIVYRDEDGRRYTEYDELTEEEVDKRFEELEQAGFVNITATAMP